MPHAARRLPLVALLGAALLPGCSATPDMSAAAPPSSAAPIAEAPSIAPASAPFAAVEAGRFELPWAMSFLPDGRLLVTEMGGSLRLFDPSTGRTTTVAGTPKTVKVSQGGLGDVVLHPRFARNGLVYVSYVEAGDGELFGGAVARGRLVLDGDGGGRLEDLRTIWRQVPKQTGGAHFGYRIAFDREGMLWISSSERMKFDPAQDMATNLGKMIRLADDGSVPRDNPFVARGGVAAQVWSLGHRNILGVAFDAQGRLWAHEMGPKGGDELNLIRKGANYGYPIVSNGDHYDGKPIPDHPTRPEFPAPVITWNPVISPAGFVIYSGDRFPAWRGSGFIGGLSSKALVRVAFDGDTAREAERWDMGTRIRDVEQGPDGTLWVLEDGNRGSKGRLFRLTPKG